MPNKCPKWSSVASGNAPSRHDADGYLRTQYLERRCVAESLRAVGKWASKTAADAVRKDCGNCALDSSYPHGQPCPGCVGGSLWTAKRSSALSALEQRVEALEADRATLRAIRDTLAALECKGLGKWPVSEHEIKRMVEDGVGRILAALESAKAKRAGKAKR
jgi:hypothetical protein